MCYLLGYFIYKNSVQQIVNCIYCFYNAYTGKSALEYIASALFNVFFSATPIIAMTIYDEDVPEDTALRFPELYVLGQQNYHVCCTITCINLQR